MKQTASFQKMNGKFFSAVTLYILLSQIERRLWIEALKYMFIEEAVWVLLNNDEESWASETPGKFLRNLP